MQMEWLLENLNISQDFGETQEEDLLRSRGYNAYSVYTYPYEKFNTYRVQKRKGGNPGNQNRKAHYIDCVCAFDIETSVLPDIDESIMYVWQFCIKDDLIIGRTWDEFIYFVEQLEEFKRVEESKIVVYVHNLSYEFQYLSGIYDFSKDDVFALDSRKPVKVYLGDIIEFRCSYIHSNMSLQEFTHKMQVEHEKKSGVDFDYSIIRYPDTELTAEELEYCANDVLGLVEAIQKELEIEGDNLYTIPLTSTGYVRREMKKEIKKSALYLTKYGIPNLELYYALRQAFRGGNTHASRFYSGRILNNVHSVDISSAYPDAIINRKYPISEFREIEGKNCNITYLFRLMEREKALLIDFTMYDLELIGNNPCPFLSISKCVEIDFKNVETDNGRVLSAKCIRTVMNDIDFKIFVEQYDGRIIINKAWYACYQYLPQCVKNLTMKYFKDKTVYKNATGQEAVYYIKQKNKLNAIYGMFATDPLQVSNHFDDFEWTIGYDKSLEELLTDYNDKMFAPYSIGVWVTSYCREKLQHMINLVGHSNFVYCDTDSVKYIGYVDIDKLNNDYIKISTKNKAYVDFNGKRYYLGVYEREKDYKLFKTLGAKKYVYTYDDNKLYCTIAGVRKNSVYNANGEIALYGGGDELSLFKGIESFREGFVFKLAGGNQIKYNDCELHTYKRKDGKEFTITRNAVISDGEYKLNVTEDYADLIYSDVAEKVFLEFCEIVKENLR